MAEDYKPRVVSATDTTILEPGTGDVSRVMRVTFMLGKLGPFMEDFAPGTFSDSELRVRMERRAAAFRNLG